MHKCLICINNKIDEMGEFCPLPHLIALMEIDYEIKLEINECKKYQLEKDKILGRMKESCP
jgi:hypothetical protein